MKDNQDISVREIKITDVDLLVDYWFKADSDYLASMGADKNKLPTRKEMTEILTEQINLPIQDKKSYALFHPGISLFSEYKVIP